MPKKKNRDKKNLLNKNTDAVQPEDPDNLIPEAPVPIVAYWWPNMTINVIADQSVFPVVGNPQVMKRIYTALIGNNF